MGDDEAGRIRIGELARRTGVAAPLLRAWERRYGLLRPERTAGGARAYGPDDERRVAEMTRRRAEGMSASLAAAAVLAAEDAVATAGGPAVAGIVSELDAALRGFDEAAAHEALDRLLGGFSLGTALAEGVLPYLSGLGARWEAGEVSIAEEHFATTIVRGRLLALARNWGTGRGPRALLACPPGEMHDLGLVCFGLALRERGWRITMLGPNTPVATVAEAADRLHPTLVVIAAMQDGALHDARAELGALARAHRVGLAGAGAPADLVRAVGAWSLEGDPVRAAWWADAAVEAGGPPG
jgi:MerR family transcriptional regulator, light-induced transcriptional regulator